MLYYALRSGLTDKTTGKDRKMRYEEVKELIDIFEKTDLNDMELTIDNVSLRLNRSAAVAPAYTVPAMGVMPPAQMPAQTVSPEPPAAPAVEAQDSKVPETVAPGQSEEGTLVKAPIVGTFYASSAPDKPAYVKVGDTVAEGDTLCIIEAMKFMNEVPSELSGTIAEILVQDGEFVEFGQPLFRIL